MVQISYTESLHIRLKPEQLNGLSKLAKQSGESVTDVVRHAVDILLYVESEDSIVLPLTMQERQFIEGICETAGVQPSDAVKMVLLSYQTLMRSPLWKIVKPVDEILDEMREDEDNERAGIGPSNRKSKET